MGLLEKFEAVTIQSDNRISAEDKAFCERHQAAYEAAIQGCQELKLFWEDMIKTQDELLEEDSWRHTLLYLSSPNQLELSTEGIDQHVEGLHKKFIRVLVNQFNATYATSLSAGRIEETLLPKEPERSGRKEDEALKAYHEELRSLVICYQDIVELMVQQMDGRSFTDQAFYELTAQCHRAAWNTYQGTPKFERKKNVIRYTGYGCRCKSWGHSDEWELQQDTKDILKGAAFFENGVFRLYPMGFQELLGYSGSYDNEHNFPTCVKLVQLKMFKNGRVDFKFSTEAYAEKFVRDYLGEVC